MPATPSRDVARRRQPRSTVRAYLLRSLSCIKLSSVASDINGCRAGSCSTRSSPVNATRANWLISRNGDSERRSLSSPKRSPAVSVSTRVLGPGASRPIDQHTDAIENLTNRIDVVIEPFRGPRDLLVTIVGISSGVADVIIAETGADMARFPTAGHLASGAGTCPGFNDSAVAGRGDDRRGVAHRLRVGRCRHDHHAPRSGTRLGPL